MNEKIFEALQALAVKLGTTVDHLWGVLLKQAPIDGTIEFIFCSILVWFNVKMARMVVRKTLSDKPEWKDDLSEIAWVLLATLVFFSVIIVWCNAAMIIAAFFNPEYWALKQLL
jgi:uncharacterized protein involved in cysteine biosynthesis